MKTKITVLCENSVLVPFPLIAEHGLAVLIEQDDITLLDTGQGFGLINNMKTLGKDPAKVARLILSHGHFDHTGGIMPFLQSRGSAIPVFAHAMAFADKRAQIPTGADPIEVPIGMRATREDMEKAGAEFKNMTGFQKITDQLAALTEVKRPEGWKTWDARLKQKDGDKTIDDPFNDDCSLILVTESGPVVLLGCAHAGIVEILDDLSERTGYREFHAVIGGTHLETAPAEYVERAVASLKKYRVKKIAVSHCTGFSIACRMAREFPAEFANASVGAVFEF
jgi:7,8-dihydropterin-6-yl-methyl-4-(beta-D-ribofuranosyl)aminobenzene 5'-phosphate synthase